MFPALETGVLITGHQGSTLKYFSGMYARVITQSCPAHCNPVDYSSPGSSVPGILQARILELVAISSFWGSS